MVLGGLGDVRFGSRADICAAQPHVRFSPNSDGTSQRLTAYSGRHWPAGHTL